MATTNKFGPKAQDPNPKAQDSDPEDQDNPKMAEDGTASAQPTNVHADKNWEDCVYSSVAEDLLCITVQRVTDHVMSKIKEDRVASRDFVLAAIGHPKNTNYTIQIDSK